MQGPKMLPLPELHTSEHAKLVQLAMRRNDDNPGEQDSAKGELADRLSAPLQIDNHMDRFMLLQCLDLTRVSIHFNTQLFGGGVGNAPKCAFTMSGEESEKKASGEAIRSTTMQ